MQTYISMLRGINVSGQKMIKMDALRQMYELLNFSKVKTYIQSGNVVFQSAETNCLDIEQTIAQQINQTFGFEVPVMVKTLSELKTVISNNPFTDNKQKYISKLHVTFLSQQPQQNYLDKLNTTQYAPDEFVIIANAIYLFCPNGYGKTKLTNNFFETKLKLSATTRNWKTVNELANIAEQI